MSSGKCRRGVQVEQLDPRRLLSSEVITPPGIQPLTEVASLDGIGVFFGSPPTVTSSPPRTLYRTDGTALGTVPIAMFPPQGIRNTFVRLDDLIYFEAYTADAGWEMWQTDGSTAGTRIVADQRPGTTQGARPLAATASWLLTFAYDPTSGYELHRFDPGTNTFTLLADINAGSASVAISRTLAIDDRVFVQATDAALGRELWVTDGAPQSTKLVSDIRPGSSSGLADYSAMLALGNYVYFAANDGVHGCELWRSNGATAERLTDLLLGEMSGLPFDGNRARFFTTVGSRIIFDGRFTEFDTSRVRLFSFDAATSVIETLVDREVWGSPSTPFAAAELGGKLYFGADFSGSPSLPGYVPTQLYVTDGTRAGTSVVRAFPESNATFNWRMTSLVNVNDTLFFSGLKPGTSAPEWSIWTSDTTEIGTRSIVDFTFHYLAPTALGSRWLIASNQTLVSVDLEQWIAPVVTASDVDADARRVALTFDMPIDVASLDSADLLIRHLMSGSTLVPAGVGLSTTDPTTVYFTLPSSMPDGEYEFIVERVTVRSIAGTANTTQARISSESGFILAGDANRDRTVNFDDLLVLAANYNASGRTFTQGDFNYDGTVDFDDLLILAARYNATLPAAVAPASTPVPIGADAPPRSDEDRDEPPTALGVLA